MQKRTAVHPAWNKNVVNVQSTEPKRLSSFLYPTLRSDGSNSEKKKYRSSKNPEIFDSHRKHRETSYKKKNDKRLELISFKNRCMYKITFYKTT